MRWIKRMLDALKERFKTKAFKRADAAMRAADHSEREIDRIAGETHAGAERVRRALTKLELALQGRGR